VICDARARKPWRECDEAPLVLKLVVAAVKDVPGVNLPNGKSLMAKDWLAGLASRIPFRWT
jgi:hypothetical protein